MMRPIPTEGTTCDDRRPDAAEMVVILDPIRLRSVTSMSLGHHLQSAIALLAIEDIHDRELHPLDREGRSEAVSRLVGLDSIG